MASERRMLIVRSEDACPIKERFIDRRLKELGLHRAAWPRPLGPHRRLAAGERFTLRLDARGVA